MTDPVRLFFYSPYLSHLARPVRASPVAIDAVPLLGGLPILGPAVEIRPHRTLTPSETAHPGSYTLSSPLACYTAFVTLAAHQLRRVALLPHSTLLAPFLTRQRPDLQPLIAGPWQQPEQ